MSAGSGDPRTTVRLRLQANRGRAKVAAPFRALRFSEGFLTTDITDGTDKKNGFPTYVISVVKELLLPFA